MLNNLVFKSAKSIKSLNNTAFKKFTTNAAAQGSMTSRFHDIYIKELEKLQKTK